MSFEIRKRGSRITEDMKADIFDIYSKSLDNKEYKHRADFIKHKLEALYGIYLTDSKVDIGLWLFYQLMLTFLIHSCWAKIYFSNSVQMSIL